MSGRVGDLSEQQSRALAKFKENIKDIVKANHDDHYLLRWLRARQFDVPKAESMFRESMRWRQEIGADTILETYTPKEVLVKYNTGGLLPGPDRHGCPVFINPYGLVDMAGILRCCTKQELIKRFVSVLEAAARQCETETKKHGKQVEQLLYIYDLRKYGLRHLNRPAVELFLFMAKIAESNYPEVLRKVIVINAPKIFPIIWKIANPVIQEETAKKVVVLSDNYQSELLKEIDAEALPVCYGGQLTDSNGDPRCSEWIGQGGNVPEHLYNPSTPRDGMTSVTVGRGSTVQLEYEVKLPKSYIRYEFCTEGCDVGFGVFKKTSEERQKAGEMDAVFNAGRVNSHVVPEDGFVECLVPGNYVVRFDNTYSWARSKTIYYFIEILEPKHIDTVMDDSGEELSASRDS